MSNLKMSQSQLALAPALLAAKAKYPKIEKTKEGQSGNRKFKYAPIEDILEKVNPVLDELGLLVTQPTEGNAVITRIEHVATGEWRESSMPVNEEHANMQSYGIELTYRKRYAVTGILGIVTEEDTDGSGSQKRKGRDHTDERNQNGTGKGQGTISASAEIAEAWSKNADPLRISELEEISLSIVDDYASHKGMRASQTYYAIRDNEEKTYVWHLLRNESKLRTFLKANKPEDSNA